MTYILDRFEEDFALLEKEDRTMLQIPAAALPADAKEGCVLTQKDDTWIILGAETEQRAQRIRSKMAQLWQ